MNGKIIAYSASANAGVIAGRNGKRYVFFLSHWKAKSLPATGDEVAFEYVNKRVWLVTRLPQTQRAAAN